MFRPIGKGRLWYRDWVDEYHERYLRLVRAGEAHDPFELFGWPAERFAGEEHLREGVSAPVVEAWALTFFVVQSVACRKNGLRDRYAAYVRGLTGPGGRKGPFLEGTPPDRRTAFTTWFRDYLAWGDVTRYPVRVRRDGWRTVVLPRLTILTERREERFCQEVSAFFQAMFREFHRFYTEELGLPRKTIYRCGIRLFSSREAFEAYTGSDPGRYAGHWNPNSNEVVMFNESGRIEENLTTLYHEFSHRFSQIYLPGIRVWTNEGLATYLGGTRRRLTRFEFGRVDGSLAITRAAIEKGEALPLKRLTTLTYEEFHRSPQEGLHYAQACSLIHFILHRRIEFEREGKGKEFFRLAAAGKDDWRGLEAAFGLPIEEIETQWRRHVSNWR